MINGKCNKKYYLHTYRANGAVWAATLTKNQTHEFLESGTGHYFSTFIGYWKGLWFIYDRVAFNVLWLGARGNCRTDHIEQHELKWKQDDFPFLNEKTEPFGNCPYKYRHPFVQVGPMERVKKPKSPWCRYASVSSFSTSYLCGMNKEVFLEDLGYKDYKETWDYQELLFQKIVDLKIQNRKSNTKEKTPNHFLLVEHPHVYTLGKSGDMGNLLVDRAQLKAKGATFYKINRGGDITYHGPGQLVGYPILDLDNFFTDIHKYLRLLEEMVILTLREYNLKGERSEGETGVWFDVGTPFARKICAMGVRASRWVTMHGFALNINSDLGYFGLMVPCGIKDKAVTSLNVELGQTEVDLNEVKQKLLRHFETLFEAEVIKKKTVV